MPAMTDMNDPSERKASHNTQRPQYDSPPTRGLSCSIRMKYGAVEIEFGVTADYTPENKADQERRWLQLANEVNQMHDEWAKNELPHVKHQDKQASTSNNNSQGNPNKPETITLEPYALVREVSNNETVYRLRTAPGTAYGKYGIALSPEVVEALDQAWALRDNIATRVKGTANAKLIKGAYVIFNASLNLA